MKTKKIILFLLFIFLITSGAQCSTKKVVNKPVRLIVWGVYEERDALKPLFDRFTKAHQTVTFDYKKFTPEEYENQLLEAWADDRGPDITIQRQRKNHSNARDCKITI
jgi:ABC-type glycerol-3-phosphate transport system substrate-binding protein